jgi:hypothetical protein
MQSRSPSEMLLFSGASSPYRQAIGKGGALCTRGFDGVGVSADRTTNGVQSLPGAKGALEIERQPLRRHSEGVTRRTGEMNGEIKLECKCLKLWQWSTSKTAA